MATAKSNLENLRLDIYIYHCSAPAVKYIYDEVIKPSDSYNQFISVRLTHREQNHMNKTLHMYMMEIYRLNTITVLSFNWAEIKRQPEKSVLIQDSNPP